MRDIINGRNGDVISVHHCSGDDQIDSRQFAVDITNKENVKVVYQTAHDPYGGVQQTWVNSFIPELKFSGKEQDTESGLYYFGARYYDPTLYRFLSPDPVIQPEHLSSGMKRRLKYF